MAPAVSKDQFMPTDQIDDYMMTSTNENIFHVIGPLWGESSGRRWIPLTKASDVEIWCLLWSAPEQTVKQTIETLLIWDAIVLIMTSPSRHMKCQFYSYEVRREITSLGYLFLKICNIAMPF